MKHQRGFTLMELLIVLAIILIIAAVTIPSLTGGKISANEASAVASIKAIQTAQASYQTTYFGEGYAGSLAALGGPDSCKPSQTSACLIDEVLTSGVKAGYNFAVAGGNPTNGANTTYVTGAAPAAYSHTGVRRFCATEKGVIRWEANSEGSTTPPTAEECTRFQPLR
jgi:prepilin-type N-terminal cleavage/methylation domain-containing protein